MKKECTCSHARAMSACDHYDDALHGPHSDDCRRPAVVTTRPVAEAAGARARVAANDGCGPSGCASDGSDDDGGMAMAVGDHRRHELEEEDKKEQPRQPTTAASASSSSSLRGEILMAPEEPMAASATRFHPDVRPTPTDPHGPSAMVEADDGDSPMVGSRAVAFVTASGVAGVLDASACPTKMLLVLPSTERPPLSRAAVTVGEPTTSAESLHTERAALPVVERNTVMSEMLRFAACGVAARVVCAISDIIQLAFVGHVLGTRAMVALGGAYSIAVFLYLPPVIGCGMAASSRCAKEIAHDPSGRTAAVVYLRSLLIAVPVAFVGIVIGAWIIAPFVMPLFWGQPQAPSPPSSPGIQSHTFLNLAGGSNQSSISTAAATTVGSHEFVYDAEVAGLSPVEEVAYCLQCMVVRIVVAAVVWTTEYATLFEPEVNSVANVTAVFGTLLGCIAMTHRGIAYAMLVPCWNYAFLMAVLLVGMYRRRPAWLRRIRDAGEFVVLSLLPCLSGGVVARPPDRPPCQRAVIATLSPPPEAPRSVVASDAVAQPPGSHETLTPHGEGQVDAALPSSSSSSSSSCSSSCSSVLSWPELRNFAAYAARCSARTLGTYGSLEALYVVVGSRLPLPQFAALQIIINLIYLTGAFDEGNTQAINNLLSFAISAGDVPRARKVLRLGTGVAVATSCTIAAVLVVFRSAVVAVYTFDPAVAAAFCDVVTVVAVSRVLETVVQVWARSLETLERATLPALVSNSMMVSVSLVAWVGGCALKGGLMGAVIAWAALLIGEVALAAFIAARLDFGKAVGQARQLAMDRRREGNLSSTDVDIG